MIWTPDTIQQMRQTFERLMSGAARIGDIEPTTAPTLPAPTPKPAPTRPAIADPF
jgi:hypothetical protein